MNPRPLPGDPSAEIVESMFDLNADDWIVTQHGAYQTAAGEAMRYDGSDLQRVVMLEWPARRNHTDDSFTLRMMMSPEDALGLAEILAHTAKWMLQNDPGRHR